MKALTIKVGERLHTLNLFSRAEIAMVWQYGDGLSGARAMNYDCVVTPVPDKDEAVFLAALWVRDIFGTPACTYWNGQALSFYCGAVPLAEKHDLKYHTRMMVTEVWTGRYLSPFAKYPLFAPE